MPQLAKYELLSKIASGGMAEIYVARTRATGFDRVCVVKKLLPQHAEKEDFIQMFLDEGRVAAALNHPNVVQMYEFGSDGRDHYLAMEYLHGEDLRGLMRAMRAEGRLIPREHTIAIIAGVCAGLHHAHEARGVDGAPLEIVHRDVSPHNVFLTFEGGVKVVDFGIAKSQGRQTETKHGTLKGKVPYMSPEQIKGRKIDRRSDIYAVGVMLYELLLGRRPYVLPTGGEFALMMAIARNDVRPATAVDASFPPALDAIVQKAMAYDPRHRYATARELQADLDEYARTSGLTSSALALSSFMAGVFGERVDAWRAAQTGKKELAAHVVQVEEERAQSGVFEEDSDGALTEVDDPESESSSVPLTGVGVAAPQSQAAALVASTSGAVASVVELLGVTVITLRGRLDETFDGSQLGESLSGTVLFDLAGIERVTSFGVREWLEMMKAIEHQGEVDAYLARCSEPIVTQLSLIRAFANPAKVVSFQVPFLCDDCGNSFSGTLDCELDAELLRSRAAPSATCPRCSGPAKHDDDIGALAFAAPYLAVNVPEKVRSLVASLGSRADGSSDTVEKHITPTETRFRIHREVDRAFRWNRVLDGVDGKVVFDFRGVLRMSPESAASFARAVRGLGSDVTSCTILECPAAVARALGRGAFGSNVRVPVVCFEGRCPSCAAQRSGKVALEEMRAARDEARFVMVPCGRCNAALDAPELEPVLRALFEESVSAAAVRVPAAAPVTAGHAASADAKADARAATVKSKRYTGAGPASPRPVSPKARIALVTVAGAAVVMLGVVAATRVRQPPDAAAASVAVATASAPAVPSGTAVTDESAAAAATPTVTREGGVAEVTVDVQAATEDAALAMARASATARLVAAMFEELPAPVREANAALTTTASEPELLARFDRDVGAFASPERVSVRVRPDANGGTSLSATYRIGAAAWTRAVESYGATRALEGVTLAKVFPTKGDGLVVVSADDKKVTGVGTGAVVETIDGRAGNTLDAVGRLARGRHEAVFSVEGRRVTARLDAR